MEFLGGLICIICAEWQKGKLTTKEAWSNLLEMTVDGYSNEELGHFWEVAEKLAEADDEVYEDGS